jgi:hypothetical protein
MAGKVMYPVFGVAKAARAMRLRYGGVDAHSVLTVNKVPRFFDRRGWHIVPKDLRSTRIALEAAGGKIRAECTELGSVKGQPKALAALLEHCFSAAPLGE